MDIPQYRERTLTLMAHAIANRQRGKKHRSFWIMIAEMLSIPVTSDATGIYFSNMFARQEMSIATEKATIFNCDTELMKFLETQFQVLTENRSRSGCSSAVLNKIRENTLNATITFICLSVVELKELQQED